MVVSELVWLKGSNIDFRYFGYRLLKSPHPTTIFSIAQLVTLIFDRRMRLIGIL